MNEQQLERLVTDSYLVAVREYQEIYPDDELDEDNPVWVDFVSLFLIFSLRGVQANIRLNRFEPLAVARIQDIFSNPEYGGITQTIDQRLANFREYIENNQIDRIEALEIDPDLKSQILENLQNKDIATELARQAIETEQVNLLTESVPSAIIQGVTALGADQLNKEYVGVITQNDNRVRGTHRPNNFKYWLRSSRRDFSQDFNCRCFYFYGSEQDMIDRGFTKFS